VSRITGRSEVERIQRQSASPSVSPGSMTSSTTRLGDSPSISPRASSPLSAVRMLCPSKVAVLALFAAALAAAPSAFAGGKAPVVFVQRNELGGNHVVVYDRGADGRLSEAGSYATGGNGGAAAPGTESDRLASQGSLAYDAGIRC
jgi:hypothetical protein